ncbi:hemolysin family protein [Ovoidimarina sediminis]|uniref:hemolysin family protein n=1 Tax=Ovoidimarina sediminis TaxID=3079856 RepID=UPI0029095064|nr:hemolysin family protein [Rhodophyticola sp. MJ-SS7]MDU8942841.1 hemolysin family protein [Rhodophyticola sp. MJ-SS7]
MGEGQDGSSSAARGAPMSEQTGTGDDASDDSQSQGLLTRFFSAFSGPEDTEIAGAEAEDRPAPNGVALPGIMNLHRMRVEDVMLPRADMVAVPVDIDKSELVEIFRKTALTRIPVYEGTLDTPLGLIHLKDLALKHGFNGNGEMNLQSMLRPLLFAPPSMPIGVLLQKMQSDRMHMALVIDEYGGVDGLVTIEDLIEQVIGEIEDEHDIAEGKFWTEEKPGCYLAQAKTPLEEFEAEIGMRLLDDDDDEEIDTLGGVVFMLAGRVPARGEVIRHPDGPDFEVVDADPRRIKRLRVRMNAGAKG